MRLQKLSCRFCGIVVSPLQFTARDIREIANDPIGSHQVRADSDQRMVGFQFSENVILGVAGVQNHQHRFAGLHFCFDFAHRLRGCGITLDKGDREKQSMGFYGLAVVRADFDVDAEMPSPYVIINVSLPT